MDIYIIPFLSREILQNVGNHVYVVHADEMIRHEVKYNSKTHLGVVKVRIIDGKQLCCFTVAIIAMSDGHSTHQ